MAKLDGFTKTSFEYLYKKLKKLIIHKNPFHSNPPETKDAIWVEPELVAEIAFSEWTDKGRLRHPSFKGLREDKKATEVVREREEDTNELEKKFPKLSPKVSAHPFPLSNPNKILYPEDEITKMQIYEYYDDICPWILPYIQNRPLTLVRCPDNYNECFYQKHINQSSSKALKPAPIPNQEDNIIEYYHYLDDKAGLLGLVQMGVLEIHPWGSQIHQLEKPDIIVFDIDPASEVPWKEVMKAALEMKKYLEELNLQSFVKTTGGKGLHVVVPISPHYEWEIIKQFTHLFVQFIQQQRPDNYVTNMSKAERKGKLFLDYLRNQRNATAIAPYSIRAKLHAPVATPIAWEELTDNIQDTFYTIKTLPKRLKELKEDVWADFWKIGNTQGLSFF
ncbi:DNA ligase D [Legionella norrlandica]|uniref:DNA ligase D n=1 Tax=Legionella norrlandica TaxID=1498499 RepID=UPI0019D3CC6E|nr:DNA ligase D [Legionella norrlandica]